MNQEADILKKDVVYEIGQIEKVLECVQNLSRTITSPDVNVDIKTAMAGYLMNFYNGIENICKRIARDYYKIEIGGESWHKDLLALISEGTKNRPSIITKETADELYDYLAFRHFFIHGYSFMLSWENLGLLVNNINNVWKEVKSQIEIFIKNL